MINIGDILKLSSTGGQYSTYKSLFEQQNNISQLKKAYVDGAYINTKNLQKVVAKTCHLEQDYTVLLLLEDTITKRIAVYGEDYGKYYKVVSKGDVYEIEE